MTTFRFTTAGESHGPGLVAIVEGMPAGLELDREALDRDMARRQLGHGRGGRMRIETDTAEVRSGVRHGRTLGSPIAVLVANRDYANWEERMNPWPVEGFEPDEVHLPRPGHADLVGAQKYGHADIRNVLERASARETAARVAAGAIARGFLTALGVEIHSHVTQIASVKAAERDDLDARRLRRASTTTRCAASTPRPARRWSRRSTACARPTRASAAPSRCAPSASSPASAPTSPGKTASTAASPAPSPRSSRSRASRSAKPGTSPGARARRPTTRSSGPRSDGYFRETNHAGGLEGGMTNGQPLSVRAAIKPISTLTKPLRSVDTETKQPAQALRERTDSTVVPAAAVVAEAMVCLALARCYREKFGGDHIDDVLAAVAAYKQRIDFRG